MFLKITVYISLVLLLTSCATHTSRTNSLRTSWNTGDIAVAETKAQSLITDSSKTDELIFLLEAGSVARANANFAKSQQYFAKAFDKIQQYENQPDYKISDEASAFITNQSYIPYKGYHYDKIMLCIYQSLNYIETKDFEKASVELKRMHNFQDNAKRENLARIEKKSKALKNTQAQSNTKNIDTQKSISAIETKLKNVYGNAYKTDISKTSEALYVNPFGYWLGGLYFANCYQTKSDIEMASSMFRICSETLGGKSNVLAQDIEAVEALANGKTNSMGNITYIIWETGSAPIRKQIRLDLPIFIFARNVPHVALNFPYLQKQNSFRQNLNATIQNKKLQFDTIADIDSIVQEEFDINLPYVITRTILSATSKATGEYFAAKAAGDYGILIHATMGAYQSMTNDADLRTWTTLPKQIKLTRFNTPENAQLNIEGKLINLDKQGVNVIYVKTMALNSKVIVRKFNFKKDKNNLNNK